ncbi:hypothetical protein MMC29_000168 [Sticta canariensis]|nr:hypothetical protein [Sticta canariensis]
MAPFDNALALRQMTEGFLTLGSRAPAMKHATFPKPKLPSLGGDHSLALPALRALNEIYGGPIAVLHFDAHLDTWNPSKYSSAWESAQSDFNHGSMFWMASNEGLILNGSSVHADLRFPRVSAGDIDELGTSGIVSPVIERIGTVVPTYLSINIDVVDPGLASTPEPGGWTSREVIKILRGLESLKVVGADIVEVAPIYDGAGEQTALVAAQMGFEIITSWVGEGLKDMDDKNFDRNVNVAARDSDSKRDEL